MAITSLVALAAVFVSLLSVIVSDKNQRKTLALNRSLAKLTKEMENRRSQIDGLREEISEYCNLTYKVRQYNKYLKHGVDCDHESAEKEVYMCELAYNKLIMRLNPGDPLELRLINAIENLKANSEDAWGDCRNNVLNMAREVFSRLWNSPDLVDEYQCLQELKGSRK